MNTISFSPISDGRANLQAANLKGTKFKDANLDIADLSQSKNFTEKQIQEAKNWERVRRDNYQ